VNSSIGSGVAFPFAVDHRGAVALAHGDADVAQALHLILSTVPGERPMRPEFGCDVHAYAFDVIDGAALGQNERTVRRALERWEPRVDVIAVDFNLDRQDDGYLEIDVTYAIRDVPGVRNLVHPFYVIPDEGEIVDAELVSP